MTRQSSLMTQKLFTVCIFLFSALVYSQTEATTKDGKKVILNDNGTWIYADCATLLKTETYSGNTMTSAKENIKVSADGGKTGLNISLVKGTTAVMLNFGIIESDIKCVNKDAPLVIEFTDASRVTVTHMGDLNCKGNFALFLAEDIGNIKELELLKTKNIKKVTLEYTDSNSGNIIKNTKEFIFGAAQADKFKKIVQCLSNL